DAPPPGERRLLELGAGAAGVAAERLLPREEHGAARPAARADQRGLVTGGEPPVYRRGHRRGRAVGHRASLLLTARQILSAAQVLANPALRDSKLVRNASKAGF